MFSLNSIQEYGLLGEYAIFRDLQLNTSILNIAEPYNLPPVCEWVIPENTKSFETEGSYVYLADSTNAIRIFDMSILEMPVERGTWQCPGSFNEFCVEDGFAYIPTVAGFQVVDFSNPDQPVLAGSCNAEYLADDIELENQKIYIRSDNDLIILSVSDLSQIEELSNTGLTIWFDPSFAVEGDYTCYTYDNHVVILDVSDPASPTEAGRIELIELPYSIDMKGTYVFLSEYLGIRIFDISDPMHPEEVGAALDMPTTYEIDVVDEIAYVRGHDYFSVFDCTEAVATSEEEIPVVETSNFTNHPNPFNPETTISYSLAYPGEVEITIYNVRGQQVRALQKGWQDAGEHSVVWNGRDDQGSPVGSGVYLSRMESSGNSCTRKMLLLK